MIDTQALSPAFEALDHCDHALRELEARCCEPSRSPDMAALGEALAEARDLLEGVTAGAPAAEAMRRLEGARAHTRRLQAECCAPGRMPFYTMILEDLANARRALDQATGH